jgi:pSer/pThr/pTyr-binding forkhead associated (FHA) protein
VDFDLIDVTNPHPIYHQQDTGSSNGTFINNHRLSEASFASEPYEVNSGDVVQFGVEVVENERKDTHGCIIATLKLYLPDGPETKTRQADTKVSAADLYRLNQYMQEAVKREHILETKLLNLQKNIQLTRKNSANNWQAMIDEDRLLSRIDYLEKKLQYFEKNVTEDKLKEDVIKLQEDKNEYQNSAKEALRKVYQERQDALQKLTALERALITNDDECSSLRDQLMKTQQQLTDLTNELCQMQTQYDEKCSELDECKRKMELEILTCHHKMSELQFEIENYEVSVETGNQ